MPRINVNLDDVESSSQFTTLPDGKYLVKLQETSKVAKSANGAYIMWIAKVMEGEFEGKLIGWNTSLLPQALWNLKNMLEAIAMEWDEEGFELEDAFGSELFVDVSSRDYNGEPRNQVDGYAKA